jgi:hypothetical protein
MRLKEGVTMTMPGWRPLGALTAMLVAVLVGACASGGPSSTAIPTIPRSATPSSSPVESAATTAEPATAGLPATATPPAASLAVEGGDPVTGQLGSFLWGDGGSDSPWLPGSPITVGAGERLTATIADGVGIATWSARRVTAGTSDGSSAVGLGTGGPPIAFDAPAPGSWSVQLTVDFDGGQGTASYYWLVTVR